MVVALALQVGVNYANDYSDGVRGTDKERKGPVRLTATGLATPGAVKRRRVPLVRRGRGRGPGALAGGRPVAAARRRRRHRRRVALHRRTQAVRLPRPRRGDGARVLRVRGDGRFRVRAGEVRARRGVVGLARRRAAGVRHPPRQQRARRPDRRGHRQAHARGSGRARRPRGACSSRATSARSLAVVAIGITQPWALLGLLALPLAVAPVRTDPHPHRSAVAGRRRWWRRRSSKSSSRCW